MEEADMSTFQGLLYVKHGAVGTKSEGPLYFLQTRTGDLLLEHGQRNAWEPDYHLEYFNRRIVQIDGTPIDEKTIEVTRVIPLSATTLP